VYGLLRHSTEISGSTLFMPDPQMLPLADLPILGAITPATGDDELRERVRLAAHSNGACLRVEIGSHNTDSVRIIGNRIAAALQAASFPADRALVLLVSENLGKVLGQYATGWGALPVRLMVIDEIPPRDAQYARIGQPRQQVVPVSFFGLKEDGAKS
jgi:ethanolamine utilization protein EutA